MTGRDDPQAVHGFGSAECFRNWMDLRLDFPHSVPLRRSYVVASSYRCGSTFFCSQLWRTGVLGAPAEYLNIGDGRMLRDVMMRRLEAVSPGDYVQKLLARRTSRNGIFGLKVHFHHFEPALRWYPALLERLAPVSFIYLDRRDLLNQAVSMAMAMQTNVWTSMDQAPDKAAHYDQDLISRCLASLQHQKFSWLRWFDRSHVTPHLVTYGDLLADPIETVRSVVDLMDAEEDPREEIYPPATRQQRTMTNMDWAARYRRDIGPHRAEHLKD